MLLLNQDKGRKILGKNILWAIYSVNIDFRRVVCSINIILSIIHLVKYSAERSLNKLFNEKLQNLLNVFTE